MTDVCRFLSLDWFVDFRLEAGDRVFGVHKLIICAHSHYFSRLIQSNCKVSKLTRSRIVSLIMLVDSFGLRMHKTAR